MWPARQRVAGASRRAMKLIKVQLQIVMRCLLTSIKTLSVRCGEEKNTHE